MKNGTPPKSPAMKPMNTTSAPMPARGPVVPPSVKGSTVASTQPKYRMAQPKVGTLSNDRHAKGMRPGK